ncbi:hypothetical protein [Sanguibacter suarezii]|nr:hypothetical protein [Sanguibacter suarezii]
MSVRERRDGPRRGVETVLDVSWIVADAQDDVLDGVNGWRCERG